MTAVYINEVPQHVKFTIKKPDDVIPEEVKWSGKYDVPQIGVCTVNVRHSQQSPSVDCYVP